MQKYFVHTLKELCINNVSIFDSILIARNIHSIQQNKTTQYNSNQSKQVVMFAYPRYIFT